MRTANDAVETSVAGIFCRLFEGRNGGLSARLAREILRVGFSEAALSRMEELAEKNRLGLLSAKDRRELRNYVTVGDLLSLLHLKARSALKGEKGRSRKHG
jgi:hypothetical protein